MRKINNLIIISISVVSYIIGLNYLKNTLVVDFLKSIMILPVLLIPRIINKKIRIDIKLEMLYLLFIIFAYFLGVIINLYDMISFYDTLMHFVSGIFEAYLIIYILKYKNIKLDNLLLLIVILGFVSFISIMWETFEYISSILFKVDPQKVLKTGVTDTMKDLLVALLGSLIVYKINKKNK